MSKEDRIRKIIELLEEKGSVTVKNLSDYFDVTMMTIRRDLEEIKSQDYIIRTHGGAIYKIPQNEQYGLPSYDRMGLMAQEKIRIAKRAAEMIEKEEMIFLGSGTTTLYIAKEIAWRDDISVVTNSLAILNELATNGKMPLIGVGGYLRRSELSMIGHITNDMIKEVHVDKVIIGMRGVHPRFGLTSDHPEELMTDRNIIGISDHIIIVADHTKIGHVAASRTAYLNAVHIIITTRNASREIIENIRNLGVKVILV